jgi:hypothetical protein
MNISRIDIQTGVGGDLLSNNFKNKGASKMQTSSYSEEQVSQYRIKLNQYVKFESDLFEVILNKGLSSKAIAVFTLLALKINKDSNISCVSQCELARASRSSKTAVSEALLELRAKGFLDFQKESNRNVYQLKFVFNGVVENEKRNTNNHRVSRSQYYSSTKQRYHSGTVSHARDIIPVKQRNNNNSPPDLSNKKCSGLKSLNGKLSSSSLKSLSFQHKSAFKKVGDRDLSQMMTQFGFKPLQAQITELEKRYHDGGLYDPNRKPCQNPGGLLRVSLSRGFEYIDQVEQRETKQKEIVQLTNTVQMQTKQEVKEQSQDLDSNLEKALRVGGLKEKATQLVKINFPTMREGTPFFDSAVNSEIVKLYKSENSLEKAV